MEIASGYPMRGKKHVCRRYMESVNQILELALEFVKNEDLQPEMNLV
jgi:hypothetical protein